jgi:hypothetical protein
VKLLTKPVKRKPSRFIQDFELSEEEEDGLPGDDPKSSKREFPLYVTFTNPQMFRLQRR